MSHIPSAICRICEESSETSLIYVNYPENQELIDKFLACANVSFNNHDNLPKYFCHQCIVKLDSAYQFKGQCERTEKKLLQLLSKVASTLNVAVDQNDLNPLEFIKSECLINTKVQNTRTDINKKPVESTIEDFVCDIDASILIKEEASEVGLLDNKSFKCSECQLPFKSKRELKYHECTKIALLFTCDICSKQFKYRKLFERHMLIHSRSYTCDICNKSCQLKKYLISHMAVHISDTPFKCKHCPKRFSTAKRLKRHSLYAHTIDKISLTTIHGDRPYKCDICTKKFRTENRLKRHILSHSHSKDKPYKCLLCSSKFRHKESLDNHTSTHPTKKIKLKTFICAICGHGCISLSTLKKHMAIHSDERPFACNLCDLKFKLKQSLKSHQRTHTGEKPYNCSKCDRGFAKKCQLIVHQKTHNDDRPYECPICKESFRSQVSAAHLARHTGEKPYDCEYCEKSFVIYSELRRHLRSHTGIKPYACTLCNLGFIKMKILEKHLKIHNGGELYDGTGGHHPMQSHEQYFKCTWCCGGFLTRRSLKFHQTKHSGGKSFVCQICGQGFATTNSLNDHVTICHKNAVNK